MVKLNMRSRTDLTPSEQLHRQVELGWKDLNAGRMTNFDIEGIKKRGRKRRALMTATQQPVAARIAWMQLTTGRLDPPVTSVLGFRDCNRRRIRHGT